MARGKGGGPHTTQGKQNSSRNSLKHGMRAKKIIVLPDEDPEELERMRFSWRREWEPEGYMEERLVEVLIYNDWMLARGERRVQEAEEEKREDVERMVAYRAQAERSFYRSWNALRQLKRDIMREKKEIHQLRLKEAKSDAIIERLTGKKPEPVPEGKAEAKPLSKAEELFQGQLYAGKKNPKKKVKILEQWVDVRVKDGKTVTTLYPSNDELIERGQRMWPPPDLVYRRFDFRNGVPKEYHWAARGHDQAMKNGGIALQRMTTDQWLICIEREKANAEGHLGPTGVGNLPRPTERGGCSCPSCTSPKNLKLLEELKKKRAA